MLCPVALRVSMAEGMEKEGCGPSLLYQVWNASCDEQCAIWREGGYRRAHRKASELVQGIRGRFLGGLSSER